MATISWSELFVFTLIIGSQFFVLTMPFQTLIIAIPTKLRLPIKLALIAVSFVFEYVGVMLFMLVAEKEVVQGVFGSVNPYIAIPMFGCLLGLLFFWLVFLALRKTGLLG